MNKIEDHAGMYLWKNTSGDNKWKMLYRMSPAKSSDKMECASLLPQISGNPPISFIEFLDSLIAGDLFRLKEMDDFYIGQKYEFNGKNFDTRTLQTTLIVKSLWLELIDDKTIYFSFCDLTDTNYTFQMAGFGFSFNGFLNGLFDGTFKPICASKTWIPLTGIKTNKNRTQCFKCGAVTIDYDSSFTLTHICPHCLV